MTKYRSLFARTTLAVCGITLVASLSGTPVFASTIPTDTLNLVTVVDTPITIIHNFRAMQAVSYGVYTIALQNGIAGIVWWREYPQGPWHPDLLLTLQGIAVERLLPDTRQAGVVWFVGTTLLPCQGEKATALTTWVRKDLGDGTVGHYGSKTSITVGSMPLDARPAWKQTPDEPDTLGVPR